MYQNKAVLINLLFLLLAFTSCQESTEKNSTENANTVTEDKAEIKEKPVRHVVLFKFKDDAKQEDVDRLNKSFHALAASIPVIKDFEWGINDSPENFHQDFTHCYLVTFDSEEDRDSIYSPHPAHQAFVKSLDGHLEKVFVVDYWTNP